jgi:RNA polymerase sigma factor (sigma-70 family)
VDPLPPERSRSRRQRRSRIEGASDEALLAGMAAGDERAADTFVRRHQRRVFGIALAIVVDRPMAEDVAQEAFVRAWRHAAVFDIRRGSAITWLDTVTRHLAIDHVRMRRAVPVDPDDVVWRGVADPATAGPDTQAEASDEAGRLRRALDELPPQQARALVRSGVLGQSAAEIAAAEAIPLGTAKSRIRLGLTRIRDHLAEDGR